MTEQHAVTTFPQAPLNDDDLPGLPSQAVKKKGQEVRIDLSKESKPGESLVKLQHIGGSRRPEFNMAMLRGVLDIRRQ